MTINVNVCDVSKVTTRQQQQQQQAAAAPTMHGEKSRPTLM